MIKVILFDLGNVVVFVNHMDICKRIAGSIFCPSEVYNYIFWGGINSQLDKGLMTPFDFFVKIKKKFDLDLDFKDFANICSSGFKPNGEIFPKASMVLCTKMPLL